jgi:hypothetical protein
MSLPDLAARFLPKQLPKEPNSLSLERLSWQEAAIEGKKWLS